jgi:hypothetical protein
VAQTIPQDTGRSTRSANSAIKLALYWYTKLFAVWIVLFAMVGYFWYRPFVFLATHKMFGAAADSWPEIFQPLRNPNLWFFALTMFGIGAVLTVADFKNIAKRPAIVLIGTLAQFTIMPLGAFALSKLFGLPPMLAAGLIIAGCAPGAMSSNVMSYIAGADTAYSVSLTAVPDPHARTDQTADRSGSARIVLEHVLSDHLHGRPAAGGGILSAAFLQQDHRKDQRCVPRDLRNIHHLRLHTGHRRQPRANAPGHTQHYRRCRPAQCLRHGLRLRCGFIL